MSSGRIFFRIFVSDVFSCVALKKLKKVSFFFFLSLRIEEDCMSVITFCIHVKAVIFFRFLMLCVFEGISDRSIFSNCILDDSASAIRAWRLLFLYLRLFLSSSFFPIIRTPLRPQ